MKKDQPKIDLPTSPLRRALDLAALLLLLAFVIFFAVQWPSLPGRIPIHFNGAGEPDGYGSKYVLLLLPLISIGSHFLFLWLNRRPHHFNYPTTITAANAERQYTLATNLMSAINASIILAFFYITWRTVAIVNGQATGLGAWFLPVFLVLFFLPIGLYMIQAGKRNMRK